MKLRCLSCGVSRVLGADRLRSSLVRKTEPFDRAQGERNGKEETEQITCLSLLLQIFLFFSSFSVRPEPGRRALNLIFRSGPSVAEGLSIPLSSPQPGKRAPDPNIACLITAFCLADINTVRFSQNQM